MVGRYSVRVYTDRSSLLIARSRSDSVCPCLSVEAVVRFLTPQACAGRSSARVVVMAPGRRRRVRPARALVLDRDLRLQAAGMNEF